MDDISIHVLRVEDDLTLPGFKWHDTDFNPRPPCGGRRVCKMENVTLELFQSTSSVWRTTYLFPPKVFRGAISIHVLRVEDDQPKPGGS